ncbi:MAG: Serine-pyruvate aminotransferase [Candidatus Dichloromethanomonas elyunquensis]|nr:MAG: Serine-pyruvate aminotransferase [Candidatus Dichloromethanomonas elyunquensis]
MPNKELLLIPGPTPVVDEIYEALSRETMGHTDLRFAEIFRDALSITQKMFNTDGEVFVIAGSGTLSMEMALVNTVAPGDKVLIVSHGYFGDRFIGICNALGIQAEALVAEWGKQVNPALIEEKLQEGNFKAVTVTHVDTSTGVVSNLEELVPVVKKYGALFILDGVCATAALEEDMNKEFGGKDNKIDVVLTASQKAIGVPPGLAIVAFGPKALEARRQMKKVASYYADIQNWSHIMKEPFKYFATHPVNMIYAYAQGMKIIAAEGFAARFRRHTAIGKAIRAALRVYGMSFLAKEEVAAPTISCILYPEGVDDVKFRSSLAQKGVIAAGALGPLAGRGFRVGHMGNTSTEQFTHAIRVIGETLQELGLAADCEQAVKVYHQVFAENNQA